MKLLLRILSVLTLVVGILSLAAGGINIGFFFHSGFPDPLAIALTVLVVVLLMVGGVLDVLCGLLGLRAAAHPHKATAAIVFGVLAVIPGAVNLYLAATTQHLLSCVVPVLYLVCAIAVKAGARRS